jgi:hypothetical protein
MLGRLSGPIFLALVASASLCASAQATITVSDTANSGPGSLRQAIVEATPGETIRVPAGTYTVESEELVVAKSLTIRGAGASATILRTSEPLRVLFVTGESSAVTIADLEIREGNPQPTAGVVKGGGVLAEKASSLTLEGDLIDDNRAVADGAAGKPGGIAEGGGVLSEGGTLVLREDTISADLARADGGEGAAGGIAEGGGVASFGPFTIVDTAFAEDESVAEGGQGPANKTQSGGIAEGGGLDAVVNAGAPPRAEGVTFDKDSAVAAAGPGEAGGGIADGGGMFTITNGPAVTVMAATFDEDVALAPSGTPAASGGIATGGGADLGSNAGTFSLLDATLTANRAAATGAGGIASGGGLSAGGPPKAPFVLQNDTLDANAVEGLGAQSGGGDLASGDTDVENTIVANGRGPAGLENCSAGATSLGHNIDSLDECAFTASGDQVNTNPRLGPLQANGGPLETQAPAVTSPAVDAGSNSGCPVVDARGVARPQGAACDVGAYELAPPVLTTLPATAVGETTATLNAKALDPDAAGARISVQYGTTTAYGATLPLVSLDAIPQPLPVEFSMPPLPAPSMPSIALSGLTPGTTYHFRVVGSDPDGTVFGGDETFTTIPTPSTGPPPAPLAPVLSGLRISPSRIRVASGHGPSIAAAKRRRGAKVSYRDSQAGVSTFTILARRAGFQVGGHCQTRHLRHGHGRLRRCSRYLALGTFTHGDTAGANGFIFSGRLGGKPLPTGSYRLQAQARNGAGQRSAVEAVAFRILG